MDTDVRTEFGCAAANKAAADWNDVEAVLQLAADNADAKDRMAVYTLRAK